MTALMWFRNDLRVADNTALHAASQAGHVRAVFIASPAQWREHDMAPIQQRFIAQNLEQLRVALGQSGIALDVIKVKDFAAMPAALRKYCRQHAVGDVFCNREYPLNEKRRDAAVEELLRKENIGFRSFDDQCIVAPGVLKNGSGRPYVVFTPFSKCWRVHCSTVPVGSSPLPARNRQFDDIPEATITLGAEAAPDITWPAGEKAAQDALKQFVRKRIGGYREQRDFPAIDGTSSLSPYLAIGVLSSRQCYMAAMQAQQKATTAEKESIAIWINELIWRDFYIHIMDAFPEVCMHRAFRTETENVQWRRADKDFDAWCEGRTGVPIVDAAMRQLVQTGWMHNRLRMIVAMFLSKNLLIDWRRGEKFFMQHLIDGFFPANNGGWQWSASTGTDAAPYFRVFNPVTQGQRFDPDGDFIRRFVPEIAHLDNKKIHMPEHADMFSSVDYPAPIVDLASSRKRAIEAFAGLK
jgi:deoxyribodipyrimidine photo-lyase